MIAAPEAQALRARGGVLALCQPGFEAECRAELSLAGPTECGEVSAGAFAAGAVVVPGQEPSRPSGGWCFPQVLAPIAAELKAPSVNSAARALVAGFSEWIRGERLEGAWPCLFRCAAVDGLSAHASAVQAEFLRQLRERLARVSRLAVVDAPRGDGLHAGLLVFFTAKGEAVLARHFWQGGQRRMADDPAAPSRSYLKIEEAFQILGVEPAQGESVVDLGAAPGGWSYSAAKRGARVVAVDNGPLKGGALGHPLIQHLREDAYSHRPAAPVDWLLCDLVDDPHEVWRLATRWIEHGWCRRFVVNLKCGRADAARLLAELRAPHGLLRDRCGGGWAVRHLHHDRDEITVLGAVESSLEAASSVARLRP